MSESRTRFERWLGTGVVWQIAVVASGLGMLYYTRMQALNAEATGRDALDKIQAEAKANFDKLETTLRATDERLAKLEISPLAARQQEAINTLQAKISELEGKYTKPEQVADLRGLGDTVRQENQNWLKTFQANPGGGRAVIPADLDSAVASWRNKSGFLDKSDKKSIQQLLDETKLSMPPPFVFHDPPKFEFKPLQPPKPQTTAEILVSTAKTYWFLIVLVLGFLMNRKRN